MSAACSRFPTSSSTIRSPLSRPCVSPPLMGIPSPQIRCSQILWPMTPYPRMACVSMRQPSAATRHGSTRQTDARVEAEANKQSTPHAAMPPSSQRLAQAQAGVAGGERAGDARAKRGHARGQPPGERRAQKRPRQKLRPASCAPPLRPCPRRLAHPSTRAYSPCPVFRACQPRHTLEEPPEPAGEPWRECTRRAGPVWPPSRTLDTCRYRAHAASQRATAFRECARALVRQVVRERALASPCRDMSMCT